MPGEDSWTLSNVSQLLGQPQHRLIHLCEKGVIQADVDEARGRGSSRRFSRRNLLQFAVGLKLRELMIPVARIAAVMHVLGAFEQVLARDLPGFRLPDSLTDPAAPELRVIISDKRTVFFALHPRRGTSKMFGGIDLGRLSSGQRAGARQLGQKIKPIKPGGDAPAIVFGPKSTAERGRIEISVTGLANDLRKVVT